MKAKIGLLGAVLINLLLSLILAWQITPVEAQVLPVLSVEPSTIEVPQGNRVQLEIEVSDGVDVNAFDIMINFDRDRLSLLNWEYGDYLSNLSCTHLIRQPGVFELACNQLAQPEVNGDGVLLVLIFNTIGIGFPDVTITEAAFIDSQGDITYPERQHGVVEVTNSATYTSTTTITRTPTQTLTSTPSPLPSSTSTITPFLSPTIRTIVPPTATLAVTDPPHPVEATATHVETATTFKTPESGSTPQPGETMIPTDDDQEFDSAVPSSENGTPSQGQILVRSLWRAVLWGLIIVVVGVLIMSIILFFLRRKQKGKEEDLLL